MFKDGTGGCRDRSVSSGFQGCGSLSGNYPGIFFLYLNDLPSVALSSTSSI